MALGVSIYNIFRRAILGKKVSNAEGRFGTIDEVSMDDKNRFVFFVVFEDLHDKSGNKLGQWVMEDDLYFFEE